MSSSARHNLSYVPEVTYGVTPASPAFLDFQHSACSLALSKEGSASNTIREDRHIHHYRHGLKQVGGEITSEFSPLALDDILAAVLMGSWVGGSSPYTLSPGTTRRSFSIMRHFKDQGSGDKPYHLFKGVEFNTLALGISTKADASFKVGCIGSNLDLSDTAPASATFGDASDLEAFTGLSGTIEEGGASIGTLSEISLNLENGIEPQFVLMQDTARKLKSGRCNLTGQIVSYFENAALLEKFINGTNSSLEFSLVLGIYTYNFFIPNVKYNGGQPDASEQTDIVLTLPFQASFDPTEETNLVITKTVA